MFSIIPNLPITHLKILDQVNLPLLLPQMNKKGLYSVPQAVTVAPEPDIDPSLIGKEGKFSWAYNVPAQGILNLLRFSIPMAHMLLAWLGYVGRVFFYLANLEIQRFGPCI